MLDDLKIEPVIIFRNNASFIGIKGCQLRRGEVLLIRKRGYNGWKQLKDAGRS
ncbi:MAG: hypothetical protein WAL66_14395 [Nitrososphaeraceae archaeon]